VALYRDQYEQLCRFAFRYVKSRQDAEEVVHDVFLRLWTRRPSGDGGATIGSWCEHHGFAYAAVRNEAVDRLRRRRRETLVLESAAEPVESGGERSVPLPDDELARADIAAAIQRAVDALPARVREVLLLKWQRGMTNAQVAESLGIARKTVEMHVTRAGRALRSLLERPLGGDG
jgi:RNA polymerase sigma-70 factor (ECF subfamily)